MKKKLMDLLWRLEINIPPPVNCHHCLTFARYGSDADGWEDKLCLQVNVAGTFHQFFLDEEDFDKPPSQLIYEIGDLLRRNMPSAQLGVAKGQYIKGVE